MHMAYRALLLEADANDAVRAIVVTGSGSAFCVGGDAKALQGHVEKGGYDAGTSEDIAMPGYGANANFDAPFAYQMGLSKPLVAALNGAAAGIGLATCGLYGSTLCGTWCQVHHGSWQAQPASRVRLVLGAAAHYGPRARQRYSC